MSFHTQKNLYFQRNEHGTVTITKYRDEATVFDIEGGEAPILTQTLDADTWCSVISSMSAGGEEGGRFSLAQDFHKSTGAQHLRRGYEVT